MYKLIFGNVKVTVADDSIARPVAAALAREAVAAAARQDKLISQIEITAGETGPIVKTTERPGHRTARKTIKQSMAEAILAAVQEKFFPTNAFVAQESWFDADTGQEWYGDMVNTTKEEILKALEEWACAFK